jgi:hypothetical protein
MALYQRDFRGISAYRDAKPIMSIPVQDPWSVILSEIEETDSKWGALFPGRGEHLPPMAAIDADGYLLCQHCGQRNRVPKLSIREDTEEPF